MRFDGISCTSFGKNVSGVAAVPCEWRTLLVESLKYTFGYFASSKRNAARA